MTTELKLSADELDHALSYLETEGQFMYLPDLFELSAVRNAWDKIRPVLLKVNLLSYEPNPSMVLIAPKQKFTVRPVTSVDPVDLILMTALGFRIAPVVERRRARLGPGVVHSWRFQINSGGRPGFSSNWDEWVQQILQRRGSYQFIAKADIVDFFPRVYLHRLENGLEAITEMHAETTAMMRFLERWSDGTSYGIPVGPRICGILAEALLLEVDEFLKSRGFDFIRYVDDYVFFGQDYSDCRRALYELGERLQITQGLSLNAAKTRVDRIERLVEELTDPSEKSARSRHEIIEKVFAGNPYAEVDYDSLSEAQKELVDAIDLSAMLGEALKPDTIDLPMVKFVLNVLAGLRRPELADIVLSNLDRLGPASEAVARFVSMFASEDLATRRRISTGILEHVLGAPFVPNHYKLWLLMPFTVDSRWNHLPELRKIARDERHPLVRRQAILAIGEMGDRSALLDLKTFIDDSTPWERRAIIFASRGLPKDERKAFWRTLRISKDWKLDNLVEKATLEYAKAKS